jgi:hypothetical protein
MIMDPKRLERARGILTENPGILDSLSPVERRVLGEILGPDKTAGEGSRKPSPHKGGILNKAAGSLPVASNS